MPSSPSVVPPCLHVCVCRGVYICVRVRVRVRVYMCDCVLCKARIPQGRLEGLCMGAEGILQSICTAPPPVIPCIVESIQASSPLEVRH